MSTDMWIWLLICDTLVCQMNDQIWMSEHWSISPRILILWRHVVRQRTTRATSRHSFITTVWWYSSCIRQVTFFNFKGKPTQCQIRHITVNATLKNHSCLLSNLVWYWASKISANILFLIIHFQSPTIYDDIPITRRHHTLSTCDSFVSYHYLVITVICLPQ